MENTEKKKKMTSGRKACVILGAILTFFILIFALVQIIGAPMVKSYAVTYGQQYLGVSVTVEDVSLPLWRGKVSLKGITVANPEQQGGYQSPYVLRIGELSINVGLFSLLCGDIVIESFVLRDFEVNLEADRNGKASNIDGIVSHALKSISDADGVADVKPQQPRKAEEAPKSPNGKTVAQQCAKPTEKRSTAAHQGEGSKAFAANRIRVEDCVIENLKLNAVTEGITVSLRDIFVDYNQGVCGFDTLIISNPKSGIYSSDFLFKLEYFQLGVDMDDIRVNSISIKDVDLTLEETDATKGRSNIKDVLAGVRRLARREGAFFSGLSKAEKVPQGPQVQAVSAAPGKRVASTDVPQQKQGQTAGNEGNVEFEPVLDGWKRSYIADVHITAIGRGVPVALKQIQFVGEDGRFEVEDLTVGNPVEGKYESEHALNIDSVALNVYKRVGCSSPALHKAAFTVKNTDIYAECSADMRTTNLKDIMDYVNGISDGEQNEVPQQESRKAKSITQISKDSAENVYGGAEWLVNTGKEYIYEPYGQSAPNKNATHIYLSSLDLGTVRLHAMYPGLPHEICLPVAVPEMGPIGDEGHGVTPRRLLKEVAGSLYGQIVSVMKSAGADFLKQGGKAILEQTGDSLKSGKDVGGTLIDIGTSVLNNWLEKKDDDEEEDK